MQVLTQESNGNLVSLKVGEPLQIRLPEMATTGYRWSVEEGSLTLLTLTRNEPERVDGAIGGVSERVFEFKAVQAGSITLTFRLARSWENTVQEAVSYEIEVSA